MGCGCKGKGKKSTPCRGKNCAKKMNETTKLWDNVTVDLGHVIPSSRHTVTFNYLGPDTIIEVTSGCSCTLNSYTGNKITVTYTIPALSPLVDSMEQPVKKTVTAKTASPDGKKMTTHLLSITAVRDGKL